ncbi:MAG: RDD family protein [bacterium]|nr:RDD family protein [Gammaproteobacteria bacterium]HIL95224.1 RDD family protein [Pseudomonadales bacterium]
MEDQQYRELIKSYDLHTLVSVREHVDRAQFENRLEWVEFEIEQRIQGIGPSTGPAVSYLKISRDENYAGIFYRLPALIIDLLVVYIPFGLLFGFLLDTGYWYCVAGLPLLYPLYQIGFTAGGQQTIGKRLLGIVVVEQDLVTSPSFGIVLRRHSPDLLFALGMILSIVWLMAEGFSPNEQATTAAKISSFHFANGVWDRLDDGWDLWIWSEILLLTFDDRRRSLHEWLSNTLVIHQSKRGNIDINGSFESSYCDWLSRFQHRLRLHFGRSNTAS